MPIRKKPLINPNAIGDRVQSYSVGASYGMIGTVRAIDDSTLFGVEFDEPVRRADGSIAGHDLSGACPQGYGWWIEVEYLELLGLPESSPPESLNFDFIMGESNAK